MGEWEAVSDDQGRTYYYNSKTQETSWTLPEESAPEGTWQEYTTDEGKKYYYNETTGETTWDKPADFEADSKTSVIEVKEDDANGHKEKDAEQTQQEAVLKSDIDAKLEKMETKSGELIRPPQASSTQEAEEAFVNLLKDNGVDSTWSFEKVISKFVKSPAYWLVSDPLRRKTLYDEFLISRLKQELSNKSAVVEKFQKNFLEVLDGYKNEGRLKYNTRWSTIKDALITEENPIFKHAVLSDKEISEVYKDYVQELKKQHDSVIHDKKEQALNELEIYLTEVNSKIISAEEDWAHLYNKLQSDPRFKANKHFNILSKSDILTLYTEKIYPKILSNLKRDIAHVEKKNYRSDRKARQSFKNLLSKMKINANSLFQDIFPQLENEDSFIELCGRNGSTPIEFFWDIVDEKSQYLKLKKDLVESSFFDHSKQNSSLPSHEDFLSSKDVFIRTLASLKDERLSTFDFSSSSAIKSDGELGMIYDSLKREFDLEQQRASVQFHKSLQYKINGLGSWLRNHYETIPCLNIVSDPSKSDNSAINIHLKDSRYRLVDYEPKILDERFSKDIQTSEPYQDLRKIVSRFYKTPAETDKCMKESLDASIRKMIVFLNESPNDLRPGKRGAEESSEAQGPDRIKRSKPEDSAKSKRVLLNY